MENKRNPVVNGFFYPADLGGLQAKINEYYSSSKQFEDSLGAVVPHAGWECSGPAAGKVLASLGQFDTYIILGPNHNGLGNPVSIFDSGSWVLPNGEIQVDEVIAQEILENSDYLKSDRMAHLKEHSIEVQLPFILHKSPEAKFVPISLLDYSIKIIKDLGKAIANAIKNSDKNVAVIASSDMTHYEPADIAKDQDFKAINPILKLETRELFNIVHNEQVTMCGLGPVCTVMETVKELGARQGELLIYTNSGETCAPQHNEVVGYAGIIFR